MKTFMQYIESKTAYTYFKNQDMIDFIKQAKEAEKTSKFTQDRFDIVKKLAQEHNLPEPTEFLNSGSSATIFHTTNPDIVARISRPQKCEKTMHERKFQDSGGVAKIFNYFETDTHQITWKEKVETHYQPYLYREYEQDAPEIIGTLNNIYAEKNLENLVGFLKQFQMTKNLAEALELGLPKGDIGEDNLGMTTDKRIVVIDC
jgi:hypothetical protein